MGLIHDPIADRGQQSSVGRKIAKQQAMVGHYDIRRLSPTAGTMHETGRAEEGTFSTQAVMAGRRNSPTREQPEVNLQVVHIIVSRLVDKGQKAGKSGGLMLLVLANRTHPRTFHNRTLNLVQARIVGETFERCIGKRRAESLLQGRQLVIHQLIEQGVGLGSHTDVDLVVPCGNN